MVMTYVNYYYIIITDNDVYPGTVERSLVIPVHFLYYFANVLSINVELIG